MRPPKMSSFTADAPKAVEFQVIFITRLGRKGSMFSAFHSQCTRFEKRFIHKYSKIIIDGVHFMCPELIARTPVDRF